MFRQLTDRIFVAPQISPEAVEQAKALGVTYIINNRPDQEEPFQVTGEEIEAAAQAVGIGYAAVPVTHGGFAPWQVDGMDAAIEAAGEGKLLAFCRSGTRSTLLWALSRARVGENCDVLAETAAKAGYDLSPVRDIMDALAAAGQ